MSQARRTRRVIAAAVTTALLATGVGVAVLPAQAAFPDSFNPFAMNGGFTVYAREDASLQNDEIEGSIAVGDTATVVQSAGDQYTFIHVSAGTADYSLPTVDGDPTRFLVGSYSPSSNGIVAITSAGTSDPALFGDLKMVQRDGPWQAFARADWLRLNTNAGNVDQTPLIDATHQQYPADASPPASATGDGSIYTFDTSATAVADYVEANSEASYEQAESCLDDISDPSLGVGYPVGLAEDVGDRVVLESLSADQPNVVDYADVDDAGLIQFSSGPTPGVANPLIIRVPAGTTTVNAARVDPQGAYSPYILWDLSAVTGSVTVTARQSRIDGSIYAPEATVTVNASPLDGQVLGRNVILQGGEVHSFMFAGQLSCAADSGSFEIRKVLAGVDEDDLPPGTTFTVNYTATEPDGTVGTGTLSLPASGEVVPAGRQFPLGTVIEFEEIAPLTRAGFIWETTTIVPNPITIGTETAEVVVTNTATPLTGTFSVAKDVVNLDPDDPTLPPVAGTVVVDWTAQLGGATIDSGSLDVPLDGTTVDAGRDFPLGTRIMLAEDLSGADPPDGYHWVSSSWNPGDVFLIDRADTTVVVSLTNALAPDAIERSVSIVKAATGEAADPRYEYAVSYNTDPAGTRGSQDIVIGDPVVLQDLEAGADILELAELVPLFDGSPVDAQDWELPVFRVTVDGQTEEYFPQNFEGAGSLETAIVDIPIPESGDVVIEVANQIREGTFELAKDFAAADGASLPIQLDFSVAWTATTPAGAVSEGTVVLPSDGTPVSPLDAAGDPLTFPYGTVVTYEEIGLPNVPGVDWNSPVYSPTQLTIGGGGEATVGGTVTNSATLADGTFLVRKNLAGVDPSQLTVDSFTVDYTARTIRGQVTTGSIQVPADGTAVGPEEAGGDPVVFPVGTVVTLTEAPLDASALPPGWEWATTSWSPTNTIIVQSDVTPELEVTNSAVELTRINVTKTITGDASGLVPDDTTFSVDWWLNGDPQPRVFVQPGEVSPTAYIPVGSIVQGTEGPMPDVAGVEWGPVSWAADGEPLTPDADGIVTMPAAAMTSGATIAFAMTNEANPAPSGAFSIAKTVIGAAAASVPADAEFTIEYTIDGGAVQTTAVAIGETVTIDDVPGGATLRIRETDPPPVDGVTWAEPSWTLDGEAVTTDADGWATVQIVPGSTLVFALVNAAQPAEIATTGGLVSPLAALLALSLIAAGLVLVARRAART